jgi:hypothetical protein
MTLKIDDLLQDPLFQLNVLLWLAQPLPEAKSDITPLFYNNGFSVYAIAPLLAPPLDVREAAKDANVNIQERCRPDVILENQIERKFVFTECKKASFSITSSTALQARSLLIVAGPRADEILGLPSNKGSKSFLAYLIPEGQKNLLGKTLKSLNAELADKGLGPGAYFILGLASSAGQVLIRMDKQAQTIFGLHEADNKFLTSEPDTDPRPLYFIPYDPDVFNDQTSEEKKFCQRSLFERMHSGIVAAAGRSNPPIKISLEPPKLLNDAMFGMYELWQNPDSARHMKRLCRQFMNSLMNEVNAREPNTILSEENVRWIINLKDKEQHEKAMNALELFSCETLTVQDELKPDLLDLMDANGHENSS